MPPHRAAGRVPDMPRLRAQAGQVAAGPRRPAAGGGGHRGAHRLPAAPAHRGRGPARDLQDRRLCRVRRAGRPATPGRGRGPARRARPLPSTTTSARTTSPAACCAVRADRSHRRRSRGQPGLRQPRPGLRLLRRHRRPRLLRRRRRRADRLDQLLRGAGHADPQRLLGRNPDEVRRRIRLQPRRDRPRAHARGHRADRRPRVPVQSGGLNESMSDIFASNVDSDDWEIGEDLPGGALRDMADPANGDPPQPEHVDDFVEMPNDGSPFNDNGGVHYNSGIPNHAYYLMVQSIGRKAAEQIVYRALTEKLEPTSGFEDSAPRRSTSPVSCGRGQPRVPGHQRVLRGGRPRRTWEAPEVEDADADDDPGGPRTGAARDRLRLRRPRWRRRLKRREKAALSGPVTYERGGGLKGRRDRLVVQPDGSATLTVRDGPKSVTLTDDELDTLADDLDQADIGVLPPDSTSDRPAPDTFGYRVSYGGDKVTADDTAMPKQLRGSWPGSAGSSIATRSSASGHHHRSDRHRCVDGVVDSSAGRPGGTRTSIALGTSPGANVQCASALASAQTPNWSPAASAGSRAPGLREAVLAGEHDAEAPARARRAEARLGHAERDVARAFGSPDAHVADRVPAASTYRWPKPGPRSAGSGAARRDLVVALRERRRGGGR